MPPRSTLATSFAACGVLVTLLCLAAAAQDPAETPKEFLLKPEEISSILDLFQATTENLDERGRLELVYHFERGEKSLSDDWLPAMSPKNPRVRWAKGWEGSAEGLSGGILIADTGQWFHGARFLPDVSLDVEFVSLCGGAKNDVVAATYAWSKGRSRIGSNLGRQCVRLAGTRAAPAGGETPVIVYEERIGFGYRLTDGEFTWTRGGRPAGSTSQKKLLRRLGPGQVGLVWAGTISACIPKVTIRGTIDLEWAGKKVPSLGTRYREFQVAQEPKKRRRGGTAGSAR